MNFSGRNYVLLGAAVLGLAVMNDTEPTAQEPASVRGRVSIGIPVSAKRATSTYSRSVATVALAPESELRHVVVYLKDAPKTAVTPIRAEIRQRGENFVPRVVAVTVGSTVDFRQGRRREGVLPDPLAHVGHGDGVRSSVVRDPRRGGDVRFVGRAAWHPSDHCVA